MSNRNWREESRCRDVSDKNAFFAARGRQSRDAIAPCHDCSVRDECLDFAVESPWQPYGVWGGLPGKQVRALWRSQHPRDHRAAVEEAVGLRKDRSM